MAIFEEKKTGIFAALLILTILFLLTYPFWHVGDHELLWNEGEYAVAVTEMHDFPPLITAHGHQLTDAPQLYLILAKGLAAFGVPLPAALRLLPILSWFILSWLVFFISKRNCGLEAACASTAILFTTVIVVERLAAGYPMALTTLLLYVGWLVWIDLTLSRSNWNLAWILAGVSGLLIYWNAGLTGLMYFIVPLALQRRPLTIWQKLKHSGFYIFLLLIGGGILFHTLRHAGLPAPPAADITFSDYLRDVLIFPVNTFLRLMPWSLLLWAPFCAALIPLAPSPLFAKFHRISFLTLLLMIWFNPASNPRDLFYLMPLMAVLVGTYYWIIVRRYGERIAQLSRLCLWLLTAAALLYPVCLFVIPEFASEILQLPFPEGQYLLRSAIASGAVCLLGILALIFLRVRQPLWIVSAILIAGTALLLTTVRQPEKLRERPKHEFAEILRTTLQGRSGMIYTNLYGLHAEGYYAGLTLRFSEPDQLPDTEEDIYFISTEAPSDPDRLWSKLLDTNYKETRLFVYKGLAIRSDDEDDI